MCVPSTEALLVPAGKAYLPLILGKPFLPPKEVHIIIDAVCSRYRGQFLRF